MLKKISAVRRTRVRRLALINGTQFILLILAVKCVQRMHNCLEVADIIGAMSLEALQSNRCR
ncbi:MAG: aromatic amino acid lyase [Chitinophagales bacterium]